MLLWILEALCFVSSLANYIFVGKEIYVVQYHRIPLTAGKHTCGDREPPAIQKEPGLRVTFPIPHLIHIQSIIKSTCFWMLWDNVINEY